MNPTSIDNFVSEIMTKENKVIKYSGYDIRIEHHKGNVFISFITDGKECIGVDYYKNGVLTLGNYYFNTPENCLRIPNDWFFNEFLIPLGKALKAKRIILNDSSSKQFTSCVVPMIFFALAGKQTFYNRYGFVNKRFDRYIEKLKIRTLRDIEVTNSLVLSKGKTLPITLMKRLIKSGYLDTPIPEVAQFVLDTCKNQSSESDVSITKDIIKYFKLKIIIENQFELIIPKSRTRSKSKSRSNSQ
jgi:hypothetical protein